jgi:hypothetical protein
MLVNEVVQLERIDFTAFPSIELGPQFVQGITQVALVRNARPLANQTFHALRYFLHIAPRNQTSHGHMRSRDRTDTPLDSRTDLRQPIAPTGVRTMAPTRRMLTLHRPA